MIIIVKEMGFPEWKKEDLSYLCFDGALACSVYFFLFFKILN